VSGKLVSILKKVGGLCRALAKTRKEIKKFLLEFCQRIIKIANKESKKKKGKYISPFDILRC